jgi:hypothetical protein
MGKSRKSRHFLRNVEPSLTLQKPNVVIGNRLPALLYAFFNSLPLILIEEPQYPFPFERFDKDFDLEFLSFPNDFHYEFLCEKGKVLQEGHEKRELYYRLAFVLSLAGLLPFSNGISRVVYDENDKCLVLGTRIGKSIQIKVNNIFLFDLDGLPQILLQSDEDIFDVIDWFDIKRGSGLIKEDILHIEGDKDNIEKAHFYPSVRSSQNMVALPRDPTLRKDVAYHFETFRKNLEKDLPIYNKLSLEAYMEELNIGRKKNKVVKGKAYYINPVITHSLRETRVKKYVEYDIPDFLQNKVIDKTSVSDVDIINENRSNLLNGYVHFLYKTFLKKNDIWNMRAEYLNWTNYNEVFQNT